MMIAADALTALHAFRADLYACCTQRRDALFDLVDALLTADTVPSPVHLSLAPVHRRGWGSLYAALADGRLDVAALRSLLARHPLADGQPIYAVDCSAWPRCDAETSPERGYYYHPSRHSAGQPIVAGWSYSWVAQLGFARDSWTAPLDVQRVHPTEVAEAVAVDQITRLVARLPAAGPAPLFVFDAGNDPLKLALGLEGIRAAILVRLRGDRCFYADPPPPPTDRRPGRPRRHGAKFACEDPATWPAPTAEHLAEDGQYGPVRVRAWSGLHAAPQNHAGRGTHGPRPIVRGTVVLVEVSRLPRPTRPPKRLWLWWSGSGAPDVGLLWRAYVRRFDIEHTLRFAKQTLLWTAPRPRHPAQADRWTWLVVAAYAQLRLARGLVAERRLPWERPMAPAKLTPYRVRRVFVALLALVGTPASPPKPCGRSPGRPKGRRSGPAPRHPAIKKAA